MPGPMTKKTISHTLLRLFFFSLIIGLVLSAWRFIRRR
jgi:hypothetical protein